MNTTMILAIWGTVFAALGLFVLTVLGYSILRQHYFQKALKRDEYVQIHDSYPEDEVSKGLDRALMEFFGERALREYKNKEYFKKVKALQDEHNKDTFGLVKNPTWKKEWLPMVKYDHDWDWAYFLDLIIYKLEKMRLSLIMFGSGVREWRERIDKELTETIELGKKLQNHDYFKKSHDFSHEHTTHYVLIYKNYTDKEPFHAVKCKKYDTIDEQVEAEIDNHDFLGSKAADNWLKENGYDKKDFHYAYSGEWDSEENHDLWGKMIQEEADVEQEDYNKFFGLIAKYMRGWWD